ncbi:UDP-3-O-(3-hydroxymyristoyl)glucosamine N-acyltransferase [Aureicoccus marinus]|uniref:UDP-3-O-(3-hydroxymyristoyl)glucosamine N-acyltransferase n=1 Tax=Aureicoccus marinus TaxID=754435 RepID=A0A2S7T541_9FLAO|nr:UDP-3-O-(3-hydroxymyristoyl)glucosamine N-acyltransferase [Aureicoccus marinus]PQJ15049.1 UDP-3-O-(3-hydroxymyristoyl)glucosamine N-acyltransferase [Aureicoccus marinus]
MKFPQPHSLKQIADLLSCSFVGDPKFKITGINEIHVVEPGDIVFVDHPKYYDKALQSAATTVLINKEVDCPEGKSLLISDDPFRDFNRLTLHFKPFQKGEELQSSQAQIGEGSLIQPGAFVGKNVIIGKNCLIQPNVVLHDHTVIGDDVIIQAGTVIGSDAFYYKKRPEGFDRLRSGGRVVIEDKVEIGAGCTIDRGVSGDTIIGAGSILDNQIQIGHDTQIGKKCQIAAQCGIAGCVIVEDEVVIWGQVGITSGITIGSKAVLLAQAGVSKSLKGGVTYFGSPAEESRSMLKQLAYLKRLPRLFEEFKKNG